MRNKLFFFTTISIILAYFPCAAAETLYRDTPYRKFVAGGEKWTSEEGQNTRAKYVGEVSNGIPNGQGTIYFPGGDSYIGEFKGGRYDGLGTYIYANGSRKSGEWRAGELRFVLLHGQGTYTSKDNGQKYLGEFFYGKYHGLGTLEFADGSKYVGEFKDHNFHGQGTFSYPNGAVYVGEYKESKRDGQGTFRYPSGAAYVGEYKDGEWYGQGVFTFADGRKYVGEFKGQSYHGQGTFTYPNGAAYVGEYKEGKRYGQGTFTFADGRKIVGSWKSIPWEATGYSSTGLTLGYFSKGTFTGRDSSAINPIEYIEKLIDNLPISFDSVLSILQLPTTDR